MVASEVKNLANQAKQATDKIGEEIGNLNGISGDVVAALTTIKLSIQDVSEYVTSTAVAVEQQSAVTSEMSPACSVPRPRPRASGRQRRFSTVVPGRCAASNPESRDSGSGAAHHPGMTPAQIGRTSTTSGTKCFSRFWMPCCNVAVEDGQPAQEPFMLR